MTKRTKTVLLIPLVIAFGVIVVAVDTPEAQEYRGKITALDRSTRSLTLETVDGATTFTVDDATTPTSAKPDTIVRFDHLAVAQDVTVRARDGDESSGRVAASVEIVDSAALVGQLEELPAVAAADTVTIVRTDLASRAIDVDTRHGPRRYRIDGETHIRTPAAPIALADLEPGQRIAVSARRDGGAFVATDIVVVVLGAEPPPIPSVKEDP